MALDAVIFDLDGTLIDTNAMHAEAWRRALEPHGCRIGLDRIYAESAVQRYLAAHLDPTVAALNARRQTRASNNGKEAA